MMTRSQFYSWAIDLVSGNKDIYCFRFQKLRFMVDHIEFICKNGNREAIFRKILDYSFDGQKYNSIEWNDLKQEIIEWIEVNSIFDKRIINNEK